MKELHQLPVIAAKLLADLAPSKIILAFVGALAGYALPTQAMQQAAWACLYLVLLDTLTGVVAVVCERERGETGAPISSARFGRVLVKLLAYFSVVSVVAIGNNAIPGAKELEGASVTAVLTYIVVTEGISVLENVQRMGFKVPLGIDKWLKDRTEDVNK